MFGLINKDSKISPPVSPGDFVAVLVLILQIVHYVLKVTHSPDGDVLTIHIDNHTAAYWRQYICMVPVDFRIKIVVLVTHFFCPGCDVRLLGFLSEYRDL